MLILVFPTLKWAKLTYRKGLLTPTRVDRTVPIFIILCESRTFDNHFLFLTGNYDELGCLKQLYIYYPTISLGQDSKYVGMA